MKYLNLKNLNFQLEVGKYQLIIQFSLDFLNLNSKIYSFIYFLFWEKKEKYLWNTVE